MASRTSYGCAESPGLPPVEPAGSHLNARNAAASGDLRDGGVNDGADDPRARGVDPRPGGRSAGARSGLAARLLRRTRLTVAALHQRPAGGRAPPRVRPRRSSAGRAPPCRTPSPRDLRSRSQALGCRRSARGGAGPGERPLTAWGGRRRQVDQTGHPRQVVLSHNLLGAQILLHRHQVGTLPLADRVASLATTATSLGDAPGQAGRSPAGHRPVRH